MSMQIKTISLYGRNGERRDVNFRAGGLNIVTGGSERGKSSLLKITEYCLGASDCKVPYGCIKDTVAWYALVLKFPDIEVFIARAAPLPGLDANSSCHLIVGDSVEPPAPADLTSSTNIESVAGFLTSKLGISENTTEVPEGQTRSPITISLKHSLYYLFQAQGEVASDHILFHRQSEDYIPQAIKDTLPYFLGAAQDDRLNDLMRLRELKRDKTRLLKRINEIESIAGEGFEKGVTLLAEAAAVGLDDGKPPANDQELLSRLGVVTQWTSRQPEADDLADPLFQLEREYGELRQQKNLVRQKIRSIAAYNDSLGGFEAETGEQAVRLQSLGLYDALESSGNCPVCDQAHEGESQFITTMRASIAALDQKLEGINRDKPRVSRYVSDLRDQDRQLAIEIKQRKLSIDSLRSQQDEIAQRPNLDAARQRVIGRITLYLESTSWDNDTERLRGRVSEIEPDIEALEEKLDPEALKERLESQLSLISEDMTRWARELKLEHSQHRIRLDMKSLNVAAETPQGLVPLYKIGSGANWVGYHLVAYLALAKWFIEQKRPVGSFIFFDQPTQVYFPSDQAVLGDLEEITVDEDREAVRRMFRWIYKVVGELHPNLQVIITDHADVNEDWFQEAVVDVKWRGDNALIPAHWYE